MAREGARLSLDNNSMAFACSLPHAHYVLGVNVAVLRLPESELAVKKKRFEFKTKLMGALGAYDHVCVVVSVAGTK